MRYKDDNKKQNIINASIQLINEIGFAEVSMSKISKVAGVSSGTIYVYFENKNDMIKELFLMVKQSMERIIFQGIDENIPLKKGFELILKNYVNFVLHNKEHFLFFEQCITSPLIHSLFHSLVHDPIAVNPIYRLLERGKQQNYFKQLDINLLNTYAFGPVIQLAKQYYNGQFEFNAENFDHIVQMSWDAIKA